MVSSLSINENTKIKRIGSVLLFLVALGLCISFPSGDAKADTYNHNTVHGPVDVNGNPIHRTQEHGIEVGGISLGSISVTGRNADSNGIVDPYDPRNFPPGHVGGVYNTGGGNYGGIASAVNLPGSGVVLGDGRFCAATEMIFRLVEGNMGALIMVSAGIMAIVGAAFGAYKAAINLLAVAVGSFILRSLVAIFFNYTADHGCGPVYGVGNFGGEQAEILSVTAGGNT